MQKLNIIEKRINGKSAKGTDKWAYLSQDVILGAELRRSSLDDGRDKTGLA